MVDQGYILLARKSLESDIWNKPPLYWKIWSFILMKAFYQDKGNLVKGQFKTTIKELQEAGSYYVGFRKKVPSSKQIRDILDYLRSTHEGTNEGSMIGTMKVANGIVISVHKYEVYQSSENYEGYMKVARRSYEGRGEGTTYKKNIKNKEINNNILPIYDTSINPPSNEERFEEIMRSRKC